MTRTTLLALGFFLSALALNAGPKCAEAKTYLSDKVEQIKQMSEKKPSGKHSQAAINRFKKTLAALKEETEKSNGNEKKCERLIKNIKHKLEKKHSHKSGAHKDKKHHPKEDKGEHDEAKK